MRGAAGPAGILADDSHVDTITQQDIMLRREQLAQLSVHADIASKLNRLIDEKALVDMGKLEQDLVYGNATSKEVVTFLGYHQQLPTQEKVCSALSRPLGTVPGLDVPQEATGCVQEGSAR